MTSDPKYKDAYVWTWLPRHTKPVVAGRLAVDGDLLVFNYGKSYLGRKDSIPLYVPELPLKQGDLPLLGGLKMPNCIRDAAPDAWGRRVIINKMLGAKGKEIDVGKFDELTFLLDSGSDRIGALDFQVSPSDYVPREYDHATLDELLNAAKLVEAGIPLTPALDRALFHGSTIGGARPKSSITTRNKKYIAKFSSQSDLFSVVKAEFIAMSLASAVGLHVAPVHLEGVAGKDVLLIERFDREKVANGWIRKAMVSALTLLELDEMMVRYASYENLATIIRHRFTNPKEALREMFSRMLFNVLCGNNDDHARNHAAFWSGNSLSLTPGYDICPQVRAGGEQAQAMYIYGDAKQSKISLCIEAAKNFQLSESDAIDIAIHQVTVIRDRWDYFCNTASLSVIDRQLLWRRQFLNPYAFEGAPEVVRKLGTRLNV
jgi:serine/threonine-protein kinase HipA